MKITGANVMRDPFIGTGGLTLNGRSTDNLKMFPLRLLIARIAALDAGVSASLENGCLVLESANDFTVGGHQDVLDTIGLAATLA